MIYTLTTNPAIDMNVTAENLLYDKVNRVTHAVYSPNGKGLNVSFTLKHFGIMSKIMGFFGGFSGEYILNECKNMGFDVIKVEIDEITRINVFVQVEDKECKIVNKGPIVDIDKQNALLENIKKLSDIDYLVISGSLPSGIHDEYYDEIIKICNNENIDVILDISSLKLKDLLKYKPLLIKPNAEELKDIFGFNIGNHNDALDAVKKLNKMGAQNIIITSAEKGSYFYNGIELYFCESFPVKLKSSACAGDGYLGAFLSEWIYNQSNIEKALKIASATGANVAESDGLGNFSNVEKYMPKIKVHKILN